MSSFFVFILSLSLWPNTVSAQVFNGSHEYEAKVYFSGLSRPWAIDAAKDGRLFITEKAGKIIVVKAGRRVASLQGIPSTLTVVGQGGLMDIKLHPEFLKNGFIFLTYTTNERAPRNSGANTRVSRFKLVGDRLTQEKVLVQGGFGHDGAHFGSRLAISKSGYLFATFGERHQKELAQDLSFLNGKVVRIRLDGSIPQDNPFFSTPGAKKAIFSLGHRNPQGIDIRPESDLPVVSEHGPTGYDAKLPGVGGVGKADEVNAIFSGRNYGWPVVFGDPSILNWTREMKSFAKKHRVVMPVREFTVPDGIAPSGVSFYSGSKFAQWQGDLFVAALRGHIVRLKISSGGKMLEQEKLLPRGFSRLRDVVTGEDGFIYALEDLRNGKIIQIRPAL